ncbi:MAG: glycerol-3-phosphate 1-O-acyltransferase PlsY [Gemmataceae bacterium]|nr:glycerol-3-phosphate 1-O-acyltransferase PlsY [Gemmataceae bacterium]
MHTWVAGSLVIGAYLLGAVPFGWLIARSRGIDIFTRGSGNIGATNVGRVLGRKFGAMVLLLDFAKGAVPVAVATASQDLGAAIFGKQGWLEIVTGLAAFLGHCYPVYLGFRGGKGVATGLGVVTMLLLHQPAPLLAAGLMFLVVVAVTRYVSLASVSAAATLAMAQWFVTHGDVTEPRTAFCLIAACVVAMRHRSNLTRLWRGEESQLKETVLMTMLPRVLHVLALGLWFGMAVFFTFVVALSLFGTFEEIGQKPKDERPVWLPLPPVFSVVDKNINGPKEQGTRVAGQAVAPIFAWYFLMQGTCGLIALVTACRWREGGFAQRCRLVLLALALAGVLAGWPIERHVAALRPQRDAAVDRYLEEAATTVAAEPASLPAMRAARDEFGRWHGISVVVNLLVLVTVSAAMGLTANLPPR